MSLPFCPGLPFHAPVLLLKPEFTEQRYVGRTERFVTYGGVKRSVALNFNVVAFSAEEQYGMWQRVNYLSGLAFPKNVVNGFMVPPLFKITVGGLYDNQPCYLFLVCFNTSITPIIATMPIRLIIITPVMLKYYFWFNKSK